MEKTFFKAYLPYSPTLPECLRMEVVFHLSKASKLCFIVWKYKKFDGENYFRNDTTWGSMLQESWDLTEANENDLISAFLNLARNNPGDFKKLHNILKEHDEVTFPSIEKARQIMVSDFDFV